MARTTRTAELNDFKSQINLCQYMAARGYELCRKKSSRGSAVMRHPSGEKLIVSRQRNGHWTFFNVHDDRDKGTIIDFVQIRDRCSIGEVRKTLRQWSGSDFQFTRRNGQQLPELKPSEHDLARVRRRWQQAGSIENGHDYLENERQLPHSVITSPVFAGRICSSPRGNALFAHHDAEGNLTGFEAKNRGFTGFAPGGQKTLFGSRPRSSDRELWICETAIDLLSVAALHGTRGKRLVSIAGQPSPVQVSQLLSIVKLLPPTGRVVLAFDNDPGGRRLAERLTEALSTSLRTEQTIATFLPEIEGEDFNDVLRRKSATTGRATARMDLSSVFQAVCGSLVQIGQPFAAATSGPHSPSPTSTG